MPNDSGQHAFTCTPDSLLASTPCLTCLSSKQLLAAFLGVLAISDRTYGSDLAGLLKDSACFTCMSKKQMLQALVTITGSEVLGEGTTVPEVIDYIKCLDCASEKQLLAAILYLLCNTITFTVEPLPT